MDDLTKEQWSYITGFFQGDGSLSGGENSKGKMGVELSARDRDILDTLEQILPFASQRSERVRDTNFKKGFHAASLTVCDLEARKIFAERGVPYGPKSEIIEPPTWDYSKEDYIRGLVDADGSVGFTKRGFPFLSLTTSSDAIKDLFEGYVEEATGLRKRNNRNTRDGVYNISVFKEDAQKVASLLYYEGCVALERKRASAEAVQSWTRPEGMRKKYRTKGWTADEDRIVLSMPIKDAARALDRTEKSVNIRRWRLRGGERNARFEQGSDPDLLVHPAS